MLEANESSTTGRGQEESGYTPPALVVPPSSFSKSASSAEDSSVEESQATSTNVEEVSVSVSTLSAEGGGLFAGLSLSSSHGNSPSKTIAASLKKEEPLISNGAVDEDDELKEDVDVPVLDNTATNNDQQGLTHAYDLSRSPTPVLSNVSPSASSSQPHKPKPTKTSRTILLPPSSNAVPSATLQSTTHCTGVTAVPHPDTCLRLLRKFHSKSSPSMPQHVGGSKSSTWFGWVFGVQETDVRLDAFKEFTACLYDGVERDGGSIPQRGGSGHQTDNEAVIEAILGHKGDSPSRARRALASFIDLLAIWCRASAEMAALLHEGEEASASGGQADLLAFSFDAASALVAHGCLDEVYLKIGREDLPPEDIVLEMEGTTADENKDDNKMGSPSLLKKAVNAIAEAVFIADLSTEATELSAIKFLLTAGCRISSPPSSDTPSANMEPMLRGSHILQAIRVCYHVYLNTGSTPNKTTAKAALQQITTSVFVRLERGLESGGLEDKIDQMGEDQKEGKEEEEAAEDCGNDIKRKKKGAASGKGLGPPAFPTQDHRDAYLVLRSLCKLSMQTKSHGVEGPGVAAGVAMTTSASDNTASASTGTSTVATSTHGMNNTPHPAPLPSMPSSDDHDPSFESRILALELLLHLLRHSSAPAILHAGPEFNYAIRQYLCTSLLKNTTSLDTTVVELSLRLFVPLIRHFRSLLKTEIEAFVTNVFFVILDSKNSTVQHKLLVVTLFEEICSDPTTLAEIFLNYDCDLSAVDLFQRIVNALGKVARVGLTDSTGSGTSSSLQYVAGAGALRAEKKRQDHRDLRLSAMKALRQVLASLHSSIVTQVRIGEDNGDISVDEVSLRFTTSIRAKENQPLEAGSKEDTKQPLGTLDLTTKKSLVEMYDSKKKRREEESQAALKFNQKPVAGLKYAAERGHLDADDPTDVARYLIQNKDIFDKAQIGEYLGREKEWQDGFALKVLRAYGEALDFKGMEFDDAIRYYLSGFRLPGEAQKIDRIMEVFAARYTDQNSGIFPTADAAFILAFSVIMLNTDLHNPAIKEDRKMTIQSFQRMNSGVCDGGDFPDEMLADIFNRIKTNPISLKEDDDARESAGISRTGATTKSSALSTASDFFFGSHYVEQEKTRENNYQKEGDQIIRDTESMLKRRRKASKHGVGKLHQGAKSLRESFNRSASVKFVGTADSGLKDEYVTPMFDVTWGPALAVFSTAIESANGTDGILASIATDEEMDLAIDNATSAIDVSLNGFQLAICIAGLCGNNTARDAYVRALYNFTLLGTGRLLDDRHIQCLQSLLRLGKDDGELLGVTWEHIFRALSEVSRLHQVWEGMARNERRESKAREKASRTAGENSESKANEDDGDDSDSDVQLEEEMDKHMIDEANALSIHDAIPPILVESIFHRSSSLSRRSLKDFVYQLCRVSRMEISGYGGHVGSNANDVDLSRDHYMKRHALATEKRGVGGSQPAIYSLQKLVEVTHLNMESRPRLIFADIWGTISTHLTSTALHEEAAVAMYAVDSLRQLSMQFLSREELGVFEFQRRFLAPLETIMSRSTHVEVKELLLSSVEQIILKYGFEHETNSFGLSSDGQKRNHLGTLRSGWRSVLVILGTAGLDKNDSIATQGFKLLQDQIQHCIASSGKGDIANTSDSLLSEHFVDLVNSLLLYVSGPRQDLSSKSIDSLLQLSNLLAEGKVPLNATSRRKPVLASVSGGIVAHCNGSNELELWWPMLLGLSQTMGDRRSGVRVKGLSTLFGIINKHFFTSPGRVTGKDDDSSPRNGDLQTLQLIFRGVLIPSLEFEEMDGNSTSGSAPELLPTKFVHYITMPPEPGATSASKKDEWINTTFEHLVDGCISICIRSLETFDSDVLIEEVLAMLNSCLLSDSGHLAVKGLRRLQQFVTSDLDLKDISEDTWATVSHMLVRVLSVRGLPPTSIPEIEGIPDEEKEEFENEHREAMNEFIREQRFFSNRRYIGCNGAMVIGSLLTHESIVKSMGLRWYIFLTSGLGKGIRDWEKAAEIMDSKDGPSDRTPRPPHYLENVLYGRRWMTQFLIILMTQNDASTLESASCQHVLKDETEALVKAFTTKETSESCSAIDMRNISKMVSDLFDCLNSLNDEKMATMKWLSPVLSKCIQTNNATIRTSVQILLTRLLDGAQTSGSASKPQVKDASQD